MPLSFCKVDDAVTKSGEQGLHDLDHARLNIRVLVDRYRARKWQASVIDELRAQGHGIEVVINPEGCALPAAIALLLTLERLVYGGRETQFGGFWSIQEVTEASKRDPDLLIDFTASERPQTSLRTLRTLYTSSVMEEAAYKDLLNNRSPVLGLSDSNAAATPKIFRIAVEDPFKIGAAMDYIGARLKRFVVDAVDQIAKGMVVAGAEKLTPSPFVGWSNRQAIAALTDRARGILTRLTMKPPHWYVGWRMTNADAISQTLQIPVGGWTRLPDDGRRYFADPFAVFRDGRHWLFVEEFPFATGKGILSAVEIGPNGPIGTPRPALELAHHLSYPFVFEHDGQMWMVPESCSAKRVELYKAVEFPWRWELVQILIDNEEVSDATIVAHGGAFWMFGTVSGSWQSSWDTLKIWTAENLFGPWTPSGQMPALIDAQGARPAGAFFKRDGNLWRPAQDCTTGYGAGLVLARVDQLDPLGFSQTTQAVLHPNAQWPGIGIHTLNFAAGLEVVDGCKA